MRTITTNQQVEIERLGEESENGNYEICWGNPLTGEKEGYAYASWLKVNGFAVSTSYMEIGEYQQSIDIEISSTGVNIVLERED